MALFPVTFRYLEGHFCQFAVLNLSVSHTAENTASIINNMFTYKSETDEKRTWLLIATIFSKTKDSPRSQPVTYTVNVVISRKRCQMASLLLGSDI